MKIVVASPLYPPDVAGPASYAKELAARLSAQHQVTVVAYGHLPESLPDVRIVAIDKQQPLLVRLFSFALTLMRETKHADVLYLQNGASAELPAGVVTRMRPVRLVAHIADPTAHERASRHVVLRLMEQFAFSRAEAVVEEMPLMRPEIISFEPYPTNAMHTYEDSWQKHIAMLEQTFTHAR